MIEKILLACVLITGAVAAVANAAEIEGVDPAAAVDPGTGIRVPAGFEATVFADAVGQARHMAVAETGWVYVALRQPENGFGAVALRDIDGDGKADKRRYFAEGLAGTGMGIYDGHLYYGTDGSVVRWKLPPKGGAPEGEPTVIAQGFQEQSQHAAKPFTFDEQGNLYVNVGAPSNACMKNTRTKGSPGMNPCPLLNEYAGIWRFDADTPSQRQKDAERYATGIRNAMALDWNPYANALYLLQHGRDQLLEFFPQYFTAEQAAELPAEEFHLVPRDADIGWPYSYYNHLKEERMVMPEYGGDGKKISRHGQTPLIGFPGHWAPNDLLFLRRQALPEAWYGGALIAFHGSWNRAPLLQEGYRVVFVPMDKSGKVAGQWVTFADAFPGTEEIKSPSDAKHRPTGLAEGPNGAIYISSMMSGGRVWRVTYQGKSAPRPENL